MTDDIPDGGQAEALYDLLAQAIDAVREGHETGPACEREAQFLAKLAFLALRELGHAERQRALIALAAADIAPS